MTGGIPSPLTAANADEGAGILSAGLQMDSTERVLS
jgi:hypothetical protein